MVKQENCNQSVWLLGADLAGAGVIENISDCKILLLQLPADRVMMAEIEIRTRRR